jgi:lipopolysaccharide transport system ATP-binding protein
MLHNGHIVLDGPTKFITMNYQKFIFSRPEQKRALLASFPTLNPESSDDESSDYSFSDAEGGSITFQSDKGLKSHDVAYLVNNYIPKSTIITKTVDIGISQMRIEKCDGEEVNHIVSGEDYVITYLVSFLEDTGQINLGIGINNELGVPVTWRFYPDCNTFFPKHYHAGELLMVRWKFRCLLIPDTYFIGITIRRSSETGNEVAFKGSDIFVFKVIGDINIDRGGYYDADFSLELSYPQEQTTD